ncbi:MAG TPA: cation diffusion facilitator family transporter [Streptosporangiaceae bacterium]|nr:cation diffusion facilitator family transporter [Streptosporangiaceae bacterium]
MSRTQRLLTVLALNLALVAGLVTVGISAHSLAVLAEGGDYLLDAAGVGVALFAIHLATRSDSRRRPAGRPAPTTIAALVNAGWLLIVELLVAAAATGRLTSQTPQVDGLPVLIVSGVAALVMAAGALILHGDHSGQHGEQERDLSIAAVLLDTVADAAAAAGVAATGAIIMATGGWYWLDPAVALTISIVIAWHALVLIKKVLSQIQSAPTGNAS